MFQVKNLSSYSAETKVNSGTNVTLEIKSMSPNFKLLLALSKNYRPVKYPSPNLKTSCVIVQKPQEAWNHIQ